MSVDPKTIFEAVTKPVLELLSDRGLGLYIPSYQRPYSWDSGKVSRLVEDISHGLKNLIEADDSFTFLGTVITIHDIEPPRDCRKPNFLREYDNGNLKLGS